MKKTFAKKILCFALVVCLGVLAAGCVSARTKDSGYTEEKSTSNEKVNDFFDALKDNKNNADNKSYSAPTNEAQSNKVISYENPSLNDEEINEIINSIKLDLVVNNVALYRFYSKEYDALYKVGLEGVPTLIEKSYPSEDESLNKSFSLGYRNFYLQGAYDLLCIDDSKSSQLYYDAKKQTADNTAYWYIDIFKQMVIASRSEIPQIISSDMPIEQKIEELKFFGIIGIIYVRDEIANGKTEYLPLFTEIGLHLTVSERETIYSDNHESMGDDWDNCDEFRSGSDNFDYTKWLAAYDKELDMLKSYFEGIK